MHHKHLILMLLDCALPIVALAAVLIFQVEVGKTLLFTILLLCPLSHLLMLGRHGHSEQRATHDVYQEADHG